MTTLACLIRVRALVLAGKWNPVVVQFLVEDQESGATFTFDVDAKSVSIWDWTTKEQVLEVLDEAIRGEEGE